MLGLYVCLGRQRTRRFEIGKSTVTIGSDEKNDLVLRDGKVQPFHYSLVQSHDRWFLSPGGAEPADVSPAVLEGLPPIDDGAELCVGDYTVVVALPIPLDPVERSLLDAIAGGDEASRLVYSDWLEGRGDLARAEYLRLQQTLAGIDPLDAHVNLRFKDDVHRLRELAWKLEPEWRQLVGRPAVEGCKQARFEFPCKMDWGTLAPTDRPGVRRCHGCGDDVYYSTTLLEARAHARQGRCVALEIVPHRTAGDLSPPTDQYASAPMGLYVPR
jgi:uncharacterized protein (TIGR02996 family)